MSQALLIRFIQRGSDSNLGTLESPWQTVEKASKSLGSGEVVKQYLTSKVRTNDASVNDRRRLSAGEEMNAVKSISWNFAIACSILITSCSRSGSNSSALNNTPHAIAGNAQSGVPPLEPCVGPGPKIPIKHVFLIVLENKSFDTTFVPGSSLLTLAAHGVLLTNYWGIGHNSLDNYIAMISGQAPNPVTQMDCPV